LFNQTQGNAMLCSVDHTYLRASSLIGTFDLDSSDHKGLNRTKPKQAYTDGKS